MPPGVNTPKWECCATISGGWLLFSRGQAYSRDRQLVLLRNLTTGEQRVLDQLQNRNGILSAGQLNGNFAVWAKCNPYPRCQIFRYDLASASTTPLPATAGKVVYSPSVNEYGTVYYGQSNRGCGKSVQLVKQPVAGGPEVIAKLPQGRDLDVTFAHRIPTQASGRRDHDADLLRQRPLPDAQLEHLQRRRLAADLAALAAARLARDDHVLEELAGATAGAAVDVAPVARLDRQAGALEDLGIELAAVVDHDHDPRARP